MGGGYGIIVNPADDTIWRAGYPGIFGQPPLPDLIGNRIDMFDPQTRAYEQYVLPPPAYGPRGIDATTDGTLWFGTGSGHLGRVRPADRGVHLLGDARAEDSPGQMREPAAPTSTTTSGSISSTRSASVRTVSSSPAPTRTRSWCSTRPRRSSR